MWVILSHPDAKDGEWSQGTGHLDEDAIKVRPLCGLQFFQLKCRAQAHLFPAADKTGAFVCGPPTLISKAAEPGLKKAGYKVRSFVLHMS